MSLPAQTERNWQGTGRAHGLARIAGLAAGAFGGIIGSGSFIMHLPVLVRQLGPKQAVPTMAIAALLANVAKAA